MCCSPRIAARNRQSSSDFLIWSLSAVLTVEPRGAKSVMYIHQGIRDAGEGIKLTSAG